MVDPLSWQWINVLRAEQSRIFTAALVFTLLAPGTGFAQDPISIVGPTSPTAPKAAPIGPPDPEGPKQTPSWEMRPGRSYLIPALEIPAYEFLLNLFDRHYTEPTEEYRTNGDTIHTHLTDSRWVLDRDQFSVNQFLHPYGGTVYFGLARSAGLNFWESFLYAGAGSFLWEIAGEKTPPSINDQITTTSGGTFLGEPLFRMANLLLESDDNGKPGFWRELAAAVISPPTGFNRLAFGNRFDEVYPSHKPATFMRLQVGGTLNSASENVSSSIKEQGAIGDFTFIYGLPGKPGYTYTRPFDYFDFHLTSTTTNTIQTIETRGLLIGTSYASSDSTRGIWGLYGATTISPLKYFASQRPRSHSGLPGRPGSLRTWRFREPPSVASVMAQPAASNARMNGIIIMAPPLKPFSHFVSFLAIGPCLMSRGASIMSPGCSLRTLKEGKISCEARDPSPCASSTVMVSASDMPCPIAMRVIRKWPLAIRRSAA